MIVSVSASPVVGLTNGDLGCLTRAIGSDNGSASGGRRAPGVATIPDLRMMSAISGSSSAAFNRRPVGSFGSAPMTGRSSASAAIRGSATGGNPLTGQSTVAGGGVNRSTLSPPVSPTPGAWSAGFAGGYTTGGGAAGMSTTGADFCRSLGAFGDRPSMDRSSCLTMSRQLGYRSARRGEVAHFNTRRSPAVRVADVKSRSPREWAVIISIWFMPSRNGRRPVRSS